MVTIAVSVPVVMKTISSDDMRCVSIRDTGEHQVAGEAQGRRHQHDRPERVDAQPEEAATEHEEDDEHASAARATCTITTEIVLTVNSHAESDSDAIAGRADLEHASSPFRMPRPPRPPRRPRRAPPKAQWVPDSGSDGHTATAATRP